MIRLMKTEDTGDVAKIHAAEIPGFLPELGTDFLTLFYLSFLKIPGIIAFVSAEKGRINGYVAGIEKVKDLNRKIISADPWRFVLSILPPILLKPLRIIKLLKLLAYPGFSHKGPELLSLAVAGKFQKRGIGSILFKRLVKEFKERKIHQFRISAYDKLPANDFYEKMGCRLTDTFYFMGERMNYYRKEQNNNKLKLILLSYDSLYANPVFSPLLNQEEFEIAAVIDSDCILHGKSRGESLKFLLKRHGWKYFLFKALDQLLYFLTGFVPGSESRFSKTVKKRGIPVIKRKDINSPGTIRLFRLMKPDLLISYFNQILKREVLSIPKLGSINIHPGYLPQFRGVASSFWAMKNYHPHGGVTLHYMKEKLDEGDIITKAKINIKQGMSLHEHNYLCVRRGGEMLVRVLNQLAGGRKIKIERQTDGRYYSWPKPDDVNDFLKKSYRLFKLSDLKLYFQ